MDFEFETVVLDVSKPDPDIVHAALWSDGDLRDATAIFDDPAALLARWRGDSR